MKKILLVVMVSFALLLPSCNTTNINPPINPLLNNEPFTNYVPWWATNSISTNEVQTEVQTELLLNYMLIGK